MVSLPKWLEHIQSVHHHSIELGLDRVGMVAQRLGLLPVTYRTIVVAGTNGKGSSVALLAAILFHAGNRTGVYSSPHLVKFNERIQIDGTQIPDADLCRAFSAIEAAREDTLLTYFEFSTLAALWWFKDRQVDVAVLEVGMGGRLDAVNIVTADAALITSIDIDHAAWLGPDRDRIALEKAGIMRAGKPAICSDPQPPNTLLDFAQQNGVPLYSLHRDYGYSVMEGYWQWWSSDGATWSLLPLPRLAAEAQFDNAAGVLMALHCLSAQLPVSAADIEAGLSAGPPPGRGQVLDGPPQVILDVAHNPAAVRVLAERLKAGPVAGRTVAVFGALGDKPVAEMVTIMSPHIDAWYVSGLASDRALPVAELGAAVRAACDAMPVFTYDDPVDAFNAARADCTVDDRICVFGSFHLVGAILAQLQQPGIETRQCL